MRKKLLAVCILITYMISSIACVHAASSLTMLTVNADINNDTGKVNVYGELNSMLSDVVSIAVFYPEHSADDFKNGTPINEVVALMAEITTQNGEWRHEFSLTDTMPSGYYRIYAGSDVYSYNELYDEVYFLNSQSKADIVANFNVAENEIESLRNSFREYKDILNIDISSDWDMVGNDISLCFIKLREALETGEFKNFSDIKTLYEDAAEIYDFMQIEDVTALDEYLDTNAAAIGFDTQNADYKTFKDDILSQALSLILSAETESYVEIYKSLSDYLTSKTVLYSVNNAAKSEMDALLKKYCDVINISVTGDYAKLDSIEVAKALFEKNFTSLADIKLAFDNRVEALTKEQNTTSAKKNTSSGSGGSFKPSVQDTVTTNQVQNTLNSVENITSEGFSDVNTEFWGYTSIMSLAEKNIVNGFEDNTFRPQEHVTREQFLKLVVSAFEDILEENTKEIGFNDVVEKDWYAEYVYRGVRAELINGISSELFGAGETILRQDAAVILYRALKPEIKDINIYGGFKDNSDISEYAKTAVYTLYNCEVLNGSDDGLYYPQSSLSRSEAAQLIYNAMKFCGYIN